jgi:hypothetical protein
MDLFYKIKHDIDDEIDLNNSIHHSTLDNRIRYSVKNAITGKGPLLTLGDKLCFTDRNNPDILIHDFLKTGTPYIAKLSVSYTFTT